ncbi:MAG: hypothetical protein J0H54_01615, partial [Rhizobiales bacterium]|nr:hypothetical protein [Hyphomicrobiales bacterium]
MANLFATAGAKLYIGSALAFSGSDFIASDFAGQSWTEIGNLSNLGSFGDTSELITFSPLATRRVRKLRGTRNAGSMQIVAGMDSADPG